MFYDHDLYVLVKKHGHTKTRYLANVRATKAYKRSANIES